MGVDAERDLLIGLLALQTGLIDRGALAAALRTWPREKGRPLADHLSERGALDREQRRLLEALASQTLSRHEGDPARCLDAIPDARSTLASLSAPLATGVEPTLSRGLGSADTEPGAAAGGACGPAFNGQRFRVLRPHARGGLGAVYVALDSELNREVALKQILDGHADDPASRLRFLVEAEVTGGLEHPGIVPVYGLGTDDDGRPYYAMRFIRGDSLREEIARFHADASLRADPGRRSIELRRLLRRFQDVCNAIEYAHNRGVVHRDIKPDNIIVGRHGETLVVDWGLAKVRGRDEPSGRDDEQAFRPAASATAETLPGSRLGTPPFMSPEQAKGDLGAMGPPSDVYSLGATLYCLLTGRPPFRGEVPEILRDVQEGAFPPPRAIDPAIDGALEAVCLKAMAREPDDRYPSARALADDIERWMADEPVSARPEPASERIRRWMRRRRAAMMTTAGVALAGLIGLSAVLIVQAKSNGALRESVERERQAKEREREARLGEAQRLALAMDAIRLFHGEVSRDVLLKEQSLAGLRQRLLKGAADFYDRLGRQLEGRTDRESLAELAGAYDELGQLVGEVGEDKREALAVHRRALDAHRALAGSPGADAQDELALARSYFNLARWQAVTGDRDGAIESYRRGRAVATPHAVPGPDGDPARAILAEADHHLGWLLQQAGRPREAGESYRQALESRRALAEAHPEVVQYRVDLWDSYHLLGGRDLAAGRLREARDAMDRGLAELHRAVALAPNHSRLRHYEAISESEIGALLAEEGQTAEALARLGRALALRRGLVDASPTSTEYRTLLARSELDLGFLLAEDNRPGEALPHDEAAVAILGDLHRADPAAVEVRRLLAIGQSRLGAALHRDGREAEAVRRSSEAIDGLTALAESPAATPSIWGELAGAYVNRAVIRGETGRSPEAIADFERAGAMLRKSLGQNPSALRFRRELQDVEMHLGFLRRARGEPRAGLDHLERARELAEGLRDESPDDPRHRAILAFSWSNLATIRLDLGEFREADEAARRSIALWEAHLAAGPGTPKDRAGLAEALLRLGQARLGLGDRDGSLRALDRATATFAGLPIPTDHTAFLEAGCHALLASLRAGAPGSSESEVQAALRSTRQAIDLGLRDPDTFGAESSLAAIRDRPEFRLLMQDLGFPRDPIAGPKGADSP